MRWSTLQFSDYQVRRAKQLAFAGVPGLDRPVYLVDCAEEWEEAEALTRWTTGYWEGRRWVIGEGLLAFPDLQWFYHIPNGGFRHKTVGAKLKKQGVKPGPFDYRLAVARGGYHGLELELKRRIGGRLSPEQERWRDGYLANGYLAVVSRGWHEARDALIDYFGRP